MGKIKYSTCILIVQFFFLSGCSNNFLELEKISTLNTISPKEHSLIFYNKFYSFSGSYDLAEKNHFILKVGENLNSTPELLHVYDNTVVELESFEARIIKEDGTLKNYSEKDLRTYNLSSSQIFQESSIKFMPIFEQLSKGDIVEVVYSHKNTMPQLGIEFSMKELGIPVNNFSLVVSIPPGVKLDYKLTNGFPEPDISNLDYSNIFTFNIKDYKASGSNSIFGKVNNSPGILIPIPDIPDKNFSWIDFGDWYLNLIESRVNINSEVESLANEITNNLNTPKEKIDAIFNYCQKNIRYEQVYLTKGEFIPNDCSTILSRKYGDCKDYSVLIYALGKSLGLNLNLALCYRGRGTEFFEETPVNQFNHMIVFYSDESVDCWYDGSNRIGIPGITSSDLINQTALILKKGASELKIIKDSEGNLLSISGSLTAVDNNLEGKLTIELFEQYAFNFFYINIYSNRIKMGEIVSAWLLESLNQSLIINKIDWKENNRKFIIEVDIKIPNSVTILDEVYYLSLNRIFPKLFPSLNIKNEEIFYFPFYNRVKINIPISGLRQENSSEAFNVKFDYSISPGPFEEKERFFFIEQYNNIRDFFNSKTKLFRIY